MQEHEIFYTPYTKEEILTAFQRALGDLTDAQVLALVRNEAAEREAHEEIISDEFNSLHIALAAETNDRVDADRLTQNALVQALDSGDKNMLDLGTLQDQTIAGITWTVDADAGTITANGTASANSFFYIWANNSNVPADHATVLSGAPAGGSATAHELQAAIGSTVYHDYGETANVPAGTIRYVTCCVRSGNTVSDLVFRPMLCDAGKWALSPAYAPFCPSLQAVYRMLRSMQQGRPSAAQLTAPESGAQSGETLEPDPAEMTETGAEDA